MPVIQQIKHVLLNFPGMHQIHGIGIRPFASLAGPRALDVNCWRPQSRHAMRLIQIPTYINAGGLLPFLVAIGRPPDRDGVRLDFSHLKRVTPAGVVALVARVDRWKKEGVAVEFQGLKQCAITGYLQRMDVLKGCGINFPEEFSRHSSHGRFVPVRLVDHRVEEMGEEMAGCVAPGGEAYGHPLSGLYDLAWYAFTEIANNIRQHSGGAGFASAQVHPFEKLVRIVLADNGQGILRSFQEAGLPWSANLSDAEAILKALEPQVSSKVNEYNKGVGLTLISGLARLTRAWLLIVSGHGVLQISKGEKPIVWDLPDAGYYQGTLIAITLRQHSGQDFPQLLEEAKIQAGLLRPARRAGRFVP